MFWEQVNVDLVITDLLMPGASGLSLIQEIKWINPAAKIIAISGGGKNHGYGLLEVAKKFGAAQVLQKPFSIIKIIEAVKRVLQTESSNRDSSMI